ncbi:MAG: hypothetical protein IIA45_12090, partial [Bacteroidetes bacterium]|nr:hypothetical protein [Bacteroidota bacterium]
STNGGVGFKNNTTLLFNDPREADAYPNLSHNGLRLYYTKDNIIYFSERDNTSDKFKASHQVAFEEIEEFTVQSAWFSKNEKELFFVDENIIYYSKRKNRKKAFTTPVIYSEMFADADGIEFVTWISFCKRKKQLFVNISTDEKDYILFFQK